MKKTILLSLSFIFIFGFGTLAIAETSSNSQDTDLIQNGNGTLVTRHCERSGGPASHPYYPHACAEYCVHGLNGTYHWGTDDCTYVHGNGNLDQFSNGVDVVNTDK